MAKRGTAAYKRSRHLAAVKSWKTRRARAGAKAKVRAATATPKASAPKPPRSRKAGVRRVKRAKGRHRRVDILKGRKLADMNRSSVIKAVVDAEPMAAAWDKRGQARQQRTMDIMLRNWGRAQFRKKYGMSPKEWHRRNG